MSETIPYMDLNPQNHPLKQDILSAIERIIDTNGYVLGPEVESFENDFAKQFQIKHAVGFNSGTSAIHIAMKLLNLNPGDEVITTPFTFAATSWAISYVGAKPVFVDIDESTYNINPGLIEDAITPKTKALSIVHLYGHPCEMESILDICDNNSLLLVEDAAQAHGAYYKGQPVGTFGNVGTFSFYPVKNLGALGEGGILITDEKHLADRARLLRNHGQSSRYYHEEIGYNYRMEAIQGAVLGIKLKYLEEWNSERLRIASLYQSALGGIEQIKLPVELPWVESAFHLYTIRTKERSKLAQHLDDNGIGYAVHYPTPLHLQPCYKELGYKKGDFPVAEAAAKEVLSLPLFPGMTDDQAYRVGEVINEFYS